MNADEKKRAIGLFATILILVLLGFVDGWSMVTAAIGAILLGFYFTPISKKRWQRCLIWVLSLSVGLLIMNYLSITLEEWLKDNKPLSIIGDYVLYIMETVKSGLAAAEGSKDFVNNQNPDFLAVAGANPGFLLLSLAIPFGILLWAIKNPKKENV